MRSLRNRACALAITAVGFAVVSLTCGQPAAAQRYGYRGGHHGHHHGHHYRGHHGRHHGGHYAYRGGHHHHHRGHYGHRRYGYRSYGYRYAPSYRRGYYPRSYAYYGNYSRLRSPYSYYTGRPYYVGRPRYVGPAPSYRPNYGAGSVYAGSVPRVPTRSAPTTPEDEAVQHAVAGIGWRYLAEGRPGAALQAFGSQASAAPDAGGPKVGYALASAAAGDLDGGVWAMRRACRIDPDALHYLKIDAGLERVVAGMIENYNAARGVSTADRSFMLATLNYLTGDLDTAAASVAAASSAGDRAPSTAAIERLIAERRAETNETDLPPADPSDPPPPQSIAAEP